MSARGQSGSLAATPTDFGPWGGMVQFDVGQNWFAGVDPNGGAPGQNNLYKAALHEIGHVFGFGSSSWDAKAASGAFAGANAVARFGAPVTLDTGRGHWAGAPGTRARRPSWTSSSAAPGTPCWTSPGSPTSAPPAAPTPRAFAVGAGLRPYVKVHNPDGRERLSFFAFDLGYVGGVRVATADVTGDEFEDVITGTTPGTANGHVKVFDGRTGAEVRSFLSMIGATAGIFVAGGCLNGDRKAELIVGADAGIDGGQVLVFDGATNAPLADSRAFASPFLGRARVAAGDGRADIISVTRE